MKTQEHSLKNSSYTHGACRKIISRAVLIAKIARCTGRTGIISVAKMNCGHGRFSTAIRFPYRQSKLLRRLDGKPNAWYHKMFVHE